jgi:hypothetical protein
MEAPWTEGEMAAAVCPSCRELVRARLVRRGLDFPRTRFVVAGLLVHVCEVCDALLGVPRQSIPQLRQGGLGG